MNDVRRGQVILLALAVVLFAVPSVFGLGGDAYWAVNPDRVTEVPEDEHAIPVSGMHPDVREKVHHAVETGEVVRFEESVDPRPYVRHDGVTYHLGLSVAEDFGNPQVTSLAYLSGIATVVLAVLLPRMVRLRRRVVG